MSDAFDDTLDIPPATTAEYAWPGGKYQCRLRTIGKARETKFSKPGDPPRAQFTFAVEKVLYADEPRKARDLMRAGEPLMAWSPVNMGPRARFRQWSEALLGRELAEKEKITPNDLVERRAFVTIGAYTTSFGTSFGVTAITAYAAEEDDEDLPPAAPQTTAAPSAKNTPVPVGDDDDWMDDPKLAPPARQEADSAVR